MCSLVPLPCKPLTILTKPSRGDGAVWVIETREPGQPQGGRGQHWQQAPTQLFPDNREQHAEISTRLHLKTALLYFRGKKYLELTNDRWFSFPSVLRVIVANNVFEFPCASLHTFYICTDIISWSQQTDPMVLKASSLCYQRRTVWSHKLKP